MKKVKHLIHRETVSISGHVIALAFLYCGTEQSKHKTVFYVLLATLIWTDLIGKLITVPTPIIAYSNGHFVGGVSISTFQ